MPGFCVQRVLGCTWQPHETVVPTLEFTWDPKGRPKS